MFIGKECEPAENQTTAQYQQQCRKYAIGAANVKFKNAELIGPKLAQNNAANQKAGDDKKNTSTPIKPPGNL